MRRLISKMNYRNILAFVFAFVLMPALFASVDYDVEVWELKRIGENDVRKLECGVSSELKKMGGKLRGFGCGLRTSRRLDVESGNEYAISFEGNAGRPSDSFIIYVKAFDELGRDVTALRTPPGGWRYSPSSDTYYNLNIKLPSTSSWQTVSRKFTPPPGVRKVVVEVSAWSGEEIFCRNLAVAERPLHIVRRLDPAKDDIKVDILKKPRTGGATSIRVKVSDLSRPSRPRALKLVLNCRHKLCGWTWHQDWRNDRLIEKDSSYSPGENIEGIPISMYPFSAVSKAGKGFAFGTPFDSPAFEHRVVTAEGIRSTVAIGLLERGKEKHGTSAEFEWLMIPFAEDWGFRSAARAYYAVEESKFPPFRAGEKEGAWFFPVRPSKLPEKPEDFGLTYWEAPETSVRDEPHEVVRAHELGIKVFAYTEAWGMRQSIKRRGDGSFPSEQEILGEVRAWAADKNSGGYWFSAPRPEAAQALLNSLPLSPEGSHPCVKDFYNSWAAWWSTNPDPRLPKPSRYSLCWDRRVGQWIDKIDGIYLDSVAYNTPIDFNNVRPDHLAVMDEPLVYDERTAQPCANGMQHEVAFVRHLARKLHPRGKRIFANIAGVALRFHAPSIDIFGGEAGTWGAPDAVYRAHNVVTDADACHRRFIARHRPLVSLLQEGHWTRTPPEFSAEGMTNYVNHHVFYAFYPGVSTIGGDEKPGYSTWRRYFGPNRQCERDRDLFKAAIPLIRVLNRAGWEPETNFRVSPATVFAERYGSPDKGNVFLALRNASDKPADATFGSDYAIERFRPGWGSHRRPEWKDGKWHVRLEPWETAVYMVVFAKPFLSPPSFVPAVPGKECAVYFRAVTDGMQPEIYSYRVSCPVGESDGSSWKWTPAASDAGRSVPLVLSLSAAGKVLSTATSCVQVAKMPLDKKRPLTLALLADSLTNCGYQDRLMEMMHAEGFEGYRPVGSRTGYSASPVGTFTPGKAAHDGYGGYTWKSFMTRYAFAVDEIDNLQSEAERQQLQKLGEKIPPGKEWRRHLLKSPLVKIENAEKKVDVRKWFGRINGGAAPDVIMVALGGNDIFMRKSDGKFPNGTDVEAEIGANINRLLDTLRDAAPDALLAVATTPSGGVQKAFETNYGRLRKDYEYRSNSLFYARLLEKVVAARGDSRVVLVPLHHALDHLKAYPDNNALHPTVEGGRMMGGALYAWIVGSQCFSH